MRKISWFSVISAAFSFGNRVHSWGVRAYEDGEIDAEELTQLAPILEGVLNDVAGDSLDGKRFFVKIELGN